MGRICCWCTRCASETFIPKDQNVRLPCVRHERSPLSTSSTRALVRDFLSFRHGEEREKQQRTLAADADAASWKQALESPVRAPTPPHGVESSASKGHSDEAVEAGRKSEKGDNVRHVQTFGDADPDQGVKGEAATEEHAREEENKAGKGESFVCNVVPLSLALEQLQIANVDLLKVDVEGDELALLHGINGEDWPKIRQVRRFD